jgi:DNA polymerase-3 subunit alpha
MNTVSDMLNGSASKVRNSEQQSIFGEEALVAETERNEWDDSELLRNEKEALGFYITGHPLTRYGSLLKKIRAKKTYELDDAIEKEDIVIGGVLRSIKKRYVRSTGDKMAYITIEDDEGSVDVIIFSELYKNTIDILKKDELIIVKGNIDKDEKGVRVRAREVSRLEDALNNNVKRFEICINAHGSFSEKLRDIRSLVGRYPGDCQLYLRIRLDESQTLIETGINVRPDTVLINTLANIVGRSSVTVS